MRFFKSLPVPSLAGRLTPLARLNSVKIHLHALVSFVSLSALLHTDSSLPHHLITWSFPRFYNKLITFFQYNKRYNGKCFTFWKSILHSSNNVKIYCSSKKHNRYLHVTAHFEYFWTFDVFTQIAANKYWSICWAENTVTLRERHSCRVGERSPST